MDKILKRNNLFNEIISYLSYKDIARTRALSKEMRNKIDSFSVWEQVIRRDYPYLIYIEEITAVCSLSILTSIAKNKQIVPLNEYTVGVIGSLGKINTHINEPDHLMRAGLLGSLSMYVSKHGVCRISLVSIPNITSARCQLRLIQVYILLCDASVEDWRSKLVNSIQEFNNNGVFRLVIFANIEAFDPVLEDIATKYPVATVRDLTMSNVRKLLSLIDIAINDREKQNVLPSGKEEVKGKVEASKEGPKKSKCSAF